MALRALDRGGVGGPEFFDRLFDRNPAERVLRFLDGGTTPAEEVAIMNSTRLWPMISATAGDAVHRVRDRVRPIRPAPAIPPAVVGGPPGSTPTARRAGPPSGEDDVRAR
ncbi:Lycopene beta-cyclase [Micromonospora saelicesensis]|nr:Lycopene beta-cyclase [Micromonospora saelicesensis]